MRSFVPLYARFVAVGVFLLLVAGALVTSTESGLAVPDWPLSYGRLMPPMVGGILYEHGHRLIAGALSTLVGIQILVVWLGGAGRTVRRLALASFGAILAQALLGGLTVLTLLPPAVSSAHAALAQIVFALAATIALVTSRSWTEWDTGSAVLTEPSHLDRSFRLALTATGATYLQILLGAVLRHTGAGLAIPDFPLAFGHVVPPVSSLALRGVLLSLSHRVGALVVLALVLHACRSLRRLDDVSPAYPRIARLWMLFVVLQLFLGALSIWTRKAVLVTTAHLAVGALCWVTGVLTVISLGRLRRNTEPARLRVSPFPPQGKSLLKAPLRSHALSRRLVRGSPA